MISLFSRKTIVTLEFTYQEVLALQISMTGTGLVLEKSVVRTLPAQWEENVEERTLFLKKLWEEEDFKVKDIAWIIPRSLMVLREMSFPPLADSEILSAIKLAAEEQFPMPADELHFSYYRKHEQENQIEVCAVSLFLWQQMIETFDKAGLRLVSAPASSWAAGQGLIYNILDKQAAEEDILSIHAGFNEYELCGWHKGEIYFHRSIIKNEFSEKMSLTLESFFAKHPHSVNKVFLIGKFPDEETIYSSLKNIFGFEEKQIIIMKSLPSLTFLATADKTDAGWLLSGVGSALSYFGYTGKGLDFYIPDKEMIFNFGSPKISAIIVVSALLIWLVSGQISFYSKQKIIEKMQKDYQSFEEKLSEIQADRVNIDAQIMELKEVIKGHTSILELWKELEKVLPPETRIDKWIVGDGEIKELSGKCKSVRQLLLNLDKCPLITDIKLQTGITRYYDEATNELTESFSIKAKIKTADFSQPQTGKEEVVANGN